MKKVILIAFAIILTSALSAQNVSFSKKDWKKFNKVFVENLIAAEKFYKENMDLKKRDEINGFPTSNIPLPSVIRNYIETAGYSSMNIYSFNSAEDAKAFFNKIEEKLILPKTYQITHETTFIYVSSKNEEGMKSTVDIDLSNTEISILFSPPLDVPIPMD
jgi:hypothetical protein